jgi:hypothetical protein
MRRTVLTAAVCVFLTASVRDASAQIGQPWIDRGFLNFSIGFESGSETLEDATTFTLFQETGTKAVSASVDSGSIIDFAIGSRVWRNVSVGLGFHRGASSGEAAISASVPNPIFFNQHRNVAFDATDLDRTERAFHIQIGYMFPINPNLDVHVFGGPSFFRVSQEVVSDATFAETGFPFTTVNPTAVVTERTDSTGGGHIGVDVSYKLYETPDVKLGGGMFIRYSGATGTIQYLANDVETDLGGFQIGFGARVRF